MSGTVRLRSSCRWGQPSPLLPLLSRGPSLDNCLLRSSSSSPSACTSAGPELSILSASPWNKEPWVWTTSSLLLSRLFSCSPGLQSCFDQVAWSLLSGPVHVSFPVWAPWGGLSGWYAYLKSGQGEGGWTKLRHAGWTDLITANRVGKEWTEWVLEVRPNDLSGTTCQGTKFYRGILRKPESSTFKPHFSYH